MDNLLSQYDQITSVINNGGVVYMPTDTIPGLACSAFSESAVEKIFTLKTRDTSKPFTIIISNTKQALDLGVELPPQAVLDQYWPGPVSLVLPTADSETNKYLHRGLESLAIRLTSSKQLSSLIDYCGPICTSSANPQGQEPAISKDAAQQYFNSGVDLYIESGGKKTAPSQIISFDRNFRPTRLR